MNNHRLAQGTLLALAILVPSARIPGDETKPEKSEKPAPNSKEVVLKGTLSALQQEGAHAVPLKKDQAYNITTDSRGFFTHIEIVDASGKKLASGTGSTTFKAPEDGIFRLLVSSPGGSSGQYVLSVRAVNLTPTTPGEVLTIGGDGLSIEAVLSKDDPLDKVRKKHCRTYDVEMSGGKTYIIDLISKQFDAFLRLEDAAGKKLAQDDDSGGGTNARIRFKAPSDGVYRIFATSFGMETGLFLLKVKEEPVQAPKE
jgi:hypothetical protein